MIYDLGFKNKIVIFVLVLSLLLTTHYSLLTTTVYAVCPICTVAVGAGLGLSRWLGIDDAVSSVWIGGLILSSSFWLFDWTTKRKYLKPTTYNLLLATFLMYAFVLIPLWYGKIIGHPLNTILGLDKILFGTLVGSLAFLFGVWADKNIRKNNCKKLLQYQKVVLPFTFLVIASLLIYYYGGYLY